MGWRSFPGKDVIGYVIAQVVGGIVAAAALYLIASGKAGFDATASGFASNGFGEHSPGGYSMLSAVVIEIILTAGFLLVIHGATDKHAPAGFAPIAIGLALTLIHLISIPVTNTSVNPARSTAVAIFRAAGHCNNCGSSGLCRLSVGYSAALFTALCWKNAINR